MTDPIPVPRAIQPAGTKVVANEVLWHVAPAKATRNERVLRREIDDAPCARRKHAVLAGIARRFVAMLAENDLYVIGKGSRHIPKDRALASVAGYSLFADGSVRKTSSNCCNEQSERIARALAR